MTAFYLLLVLQIKTFAPDKSDNMEIEAFVHTVAPLAPRLKRVAYSVLDNEDAAADASQETLMRLWINRERLEEYNSIEAVAMTTARRIALDMIRREGRTESLPDNFPFSDHAPSPENIIEQSESMQTIEMAINALPPLQRMTFRLKEIEGYESDVIARLAGIKVEAVYTNLSRARRTLRTALALQFKRK